MRENQVGMAGTGINCFQYTQICRFWIFNPRSRMSACGYKRTSTHTVIYVRFTPESGHRGL